MKKLFIAEKPDIGKTIAAYLWPDDDYQKEKGYIKNGDTTVTWAVGHILGLAQPEEYGDEFKVWANYPVIPNPFKLKPAPTTSAQLNIIKKLLIDTDVVIHAGDPDREGQLLIDEILKFFHYKKEVQRILINAKDDESMKRAFSQIVDNKQFENLYYAGLAREQADWLIGMNLTRAYTVNARKYGYDNTFRIGRVKIPTLALVVNREKEIRNFKSVKHYILRGTFDKDGIPFTAMLQPSDKLQLDEENRIKDKKILQAIKMKVEKTQIIIQDVQGKDGSQNPPLPHSLDTLQIEANKKYVFSPKEVLATVQELYEKKYVSYPRSDCNYIPTTQKEDAIKILSMLKAINVAGSDKADIAITSKAFNDKKITAHHAIIPTSIMVKELNDIEQKIYALIAERYVLQFFPAYEYKKVTFTLAAGDEIFIGSGKITKKLGYKMCFQECEEEKDVGAENIKLPDLTIGDTIEKAEYAIIDKITTAPKRFSEGTLLAAMSNIWRFVSVDNPNRDKLKEVKGIGTPATRDTIIAELQQNMIKGKTIEPCMEKVKKELVPTDFGIQLIENVDPSLTVPDTTAEMEYALAKIAAGETQFDGYMDEVISIVHRNIQYAENKKFPLPLGKEKISCPICQNGDLIRKFSQKIKKYFHLCSNPDCLSPITGKRIFYEDDGKGKPIVAKCLDCNTVLIRIVGKNGPFWLCSQCKKTYNDENNKPDLKKK